MKKIIQMFILTFKYLSQKNKVGIIEPAIRRSWALDLFELFDFQIKAPAVEELSGPVIYVANHISYLDIPLLMATVPEGCFLSKKEVARWPLFGNAAKKIETVFVERDSKESRQRARVELEQHLIEHGKKVVVFPAGTTSVSEEKQWRKGVFEIAHKLKVPVQPIRLRYSCQAQVAFVDDDIFLLHLFRLAKLEKRLMASVQIHAPLLINDIESDLAYCREWCNGQDRAFIEVNQKQKNKHLNRNLTFEDFKLIVD